MDKLADAITSATVYLCKIKQYVVSTILTTIKQYVVSTIYFRLNFLKEKV